jgi:hypothetical protein
MDGSVWVEGRTSRGPRGRFALGVSGNPAGKRKGTRNRATVLAEVLAADESGAIARVVIDKALAGDGVAARFLLGLMVPKLRSRTIELDLPECDSPDDIVAAFDVTVAAMAAGEITPDEALTVSRVLDRRRRAIEARARRRGRAETPAEIVGTGETDVVAAMAAGEITPAEALAASPKLDRRSLALAARAEEHARAQAQGSGGDAASTGADLHPPCNFSLSGNEAPAAAGGLPAIATGPDAVSAAPVDLTPPADAPPPPAIVPEASDLHQSCNFTSPGNEVPAAGGLVDTAIRPQEICAAPVGSVTTTDTPPAPPLAPAAPDLHPACNSRQNGTVRGMISWRPRSGSAVLDRRPDIETRRWRG